MQSYPDLNRIFFYNRHRNRPDEFYPNPGSGFGRVSRAGPVCRTLFPILVHASVDVYTKRKNFISLKYISPSFFPNGNSMIFSPLNHPIQQQQQQHKHVEIHSHLYLVQHLQQILILIQQAHQMTDYNDQKSYTMQLNPYRIEQSSMKWKNSFCEQINRRIFSVSYLFFLFSVVLYHTKISSDNKHTIDMRT